MKKVKNIIINFAILTASFVVFFFAAEIIVRSFYKQDAVLFPRYHTDVKYGEYILRRIRPNSEFWHTSQDGTWKFTTNS